MMRQKLMTTALAVAIASAATAEPAEWPVAEGGNGHLYEVVTQAEGVTWAEANQIAIARGGHLVTLHSEAENSFAFQLLMDVDPVGEDIDGVGGGAWIGAFQPPASEEPLGDWQWATGEPWDFTAWSTNQPNNSGGEQDWALFWRVPNNGEWQDTFETRLLRYFIVEWGTAPCPADLDLNGAVDGADLGLMLGLWGNPDPVLPADLNGDGIVDGADLGLLLGAWGMCL
jgi:hypothetical protein